MAAEKRSISGPEELFKQADARQVELGYATFAAYMQALMRADILQGGSHLRESAAAQPPAQPATEPVNYKKKSRRSSKEIAAEGIAALNKDLKRPSSPK